MTHGNAFDRLGDCSLCGRKGVELTVRGYCVDEFACLQAWLIGGHA